MMNRISQTNILQKIGNKSKQNRVVSINHDSWIDNLKKKITRKTDWQDKAENV